MANVDNENNIDWELINQSEISKSYIKQENRSFVKRLEFDSPTKSSDKKGSMQNNHDLRQANGHDSSIHLHNGKS